MKKVKALKQCILLLISFSVYGCATLDTSQAIPTVTGPSQPTEGQLWLSHEHILVDFIGADKIQSNKAHHDLIIANVLPYLKKAKDHNINYFIDATPSYLGREVHLLEQLSTLTGIKIITNTGFYGARNSKFIPQYALDMTPAQLANIWVNEYENGIDGTTIKPGFIKIGVDNIAPLKPQHEKLIRAAALAHLKTGLTIASHTGKAKALWPQLNILKELGVPAESFIWVHAQDEKDNSTYLQAAKHGCWISLDGLAWDIDNHVEKILYAKANGILDRVLISHDAGWYDPQKETQAIRPYTDIFTKLLPKLKARGFTDEEFNLLMSTNPQKAFALKRPN